MRRWIVVTGLAMALGSLALGSWAAPEEPALPGIARNTLPLRVPLDALTAPARARAEAVLDATVFAHHVGGIRHQSREDVFRFLLDHPDFAAAVARALRLGQYRVTAREDGYWGDDARGATGMIRVLYADDSRRLFHLVGRYQRSVLPAIEGQLLVLLEFRHQPDDQAGTIVESGLTGYLRLDTPVAGAVAQVVSAVSRPLVERAVERKIRRFFGTVARLSRWAHDQPEQLVAALEGHPDVPQGERLAAFSTLLLADRPPAWARTPFRLISPEAEDPEPRSEPYLGLDDEDAR